MRRTKDAFLWLISILEDEKVPYQITGGFAAKVYGSTRRLADIDVDIPKAYFPRILPRVSTYITMQPHQWHGEGFKCYLMCLRYRGQDIDVSAYEDQFIHDARSAKYVRMPVSPASEHKRVYGRMVRVIPKKALIAYKRILSRSVDLRDIAALES